MPRGPKKASGSHQPNKWVSLQDQYKASLFVIHKYEGAAVYDAQDKTIAYIHSIELDENTLEPSYAILQEISDDMSPAIRWALPIELLTIDSQSSHICYEAA